VIDDVGKHVEAGGGFYICDDGIQSEACVPILDDGRQVIGIVDVEAKPRGFFGAERLVVVAALAIVAAAVLP
jgi:putative methionine-R-sulfoxide reductase with GAF domain